LGLLSGFALLDVSLSYSRPVHEQRVPGQGRGRAPSLDIADALKARSSFGIPGDPSLRQN
jgi:hypothetical protein